MLANCLHALLRDWKGLAISWTQLPSEGQGEQGEIDGKVWGAIPLVLPTPFKTQRKTIAKPLPHASRPPKHTHTTITTILITSKPFL